MRIRSILRASTAAAVVALGAMTMTPSARALDQELQITIDGSTTIFHALNGGNAFGTKAFHGVTVIATVTSDSPGETNSAFLLGATLAVISTNSAIHSVVVSVGDTNYLTPVTPPNITATSTLGGGTTAGLASPATTLSLESYVDPGNGQNSTVGGLGAQTTYKTGNVNTAGSFALDDKSKTLTSLAAGFSMTSVTTIHLGGVTNFNFTTTLDLSQERINAVPEPSSLAIAGIGALGMVGFGLRRRKALGV
jgi:hypothetical protein